MGDLIRLADNYNDNQRLKNMELQSPDRWDVALKHISEQMQSPLTISRSWRHNMTRRGKDTKMKNIAATVMTAARTRPGTRFYNSLLEKNAHEEKQIMPASDLRSADKSI